MHGTILDGNAEYVVGHNEMIEETAHITFALISE